MALTKHKVKEIEVPKSLIIQHLADADFYDHYSIVLDDPELSLEQAAKRVFDRSPRWIVMLLAIRNFLMRPFGLRGSVPKGSSQEDVIGFFPIVSRSAYELVLGFDDKHLNFRIIVVKSDGEQKTLSAATLVKRNNLLGKIYLFFVKPFHRVIVPAMLKQVNVSD